MTALECLDLNVYSKLYYKTRSCILTCPPGSLDHPEIDAKENRYNLSVHTCQECDGECDKGTFLIAGV